MPIMDNRERAPLMQTLQNGRHAMEDALHAAQSGDRAAVRSYLREVRQKIDHAEQLMEFGENGRCIVFR